VKHEAVVKNSLTLHLDIDVNKYQLLNKMIEGLTIRTDELGWRYFLPPYGAAYHQTGLMPQPVRSPGNYASTLGCATTRRGGKQQGLPAPAFAAVGSGAGSGTKTLMAQQQQYRTIIQQNSPASRRAALALEGY